MSRFSLRFYRFLSVPVLFAILMIMFACETGEVLAKSKKGWLGLSVRELTPSMREDLKLGDRSGLLIINVVPGSPADDAGLREEDVIFKYDGKSVEQIDDFVRMVKNTPPETSLEIDIVRHGADKTVEVIIGKKRRKNWYFGMGDGDHQFLFLSGQPRLGLKVHEMNKDLSEYFKGAEDGAVLVLSVFEDSPAEKSGLKAGDVILKVEDEKVSSTEDLLNTLAEYQDGDVVTVEYLRKGLPLKTEVELQNKVEIGSSDFERFTPRVLPRLKWHHFDHGRGIDGLNIYIDNPLENSIEI